MNRNEFSKTFFSLTMGAIVVSNLNSCNNREQVHPLTINAEKCNGCERCKKKTGCKSIIIANNKARIDKNTCRGCSKCIEFCAREAISI